MPDLVCDRLVLDKDAFDLVCIALGGAALIDGSPVGAVELHLVIPFLVVIRRGDRFLAPHVVEADGGLAGVFVGHELAGAYPHFLGVVAGKLAVHLVGHFYGADVLAQLALPGRNVARAMGLPIDRLERPDDAIVVTVRDAD